MGQMNRRDFLKGIGAGAAGLYGAEAIAGEHQGVGTESPHIVYILADDLGFGVFGWLVFLTFLGTDGVLNIYVQMTPVLIVSTATALLGGLLGSMIRGVV